MSRRTSRESSPAQRFLSHQYSNYRAGVNTNTIIDNLALDSPESPRVLEVVEKTDSLAWKLEYDEDGELLQKGKVTSHQPGAPQSFKPILGGNTNSPGQPCL